MRIETKTNRKSATAGRVAPRAPLTVIFVLAFGLALGFALADDQSTPAASTTVKGFQAPLEYFEKPNELQMKSFLEGAEAEPMSDGAILIRKAKLQTFHEDGSLEMTVKAPQCVFDSRAHTVRSAGPLELQTSNVVVQGVGFFWQETNSDLIISNQQRTTVVGSMTNTFKP